jgi:hypothetical protein
MKGFALSLLAVCAPAVAQADALQQQVLAVARSVGPNDFAFTETTRAERTGKPANSSIARYDPRTPAKWTLLSTDGKPPTAKQSASSAKFRAKAKVATYARIAEWFGAPASRVATTPTHVTYRFAAMPKAALMMGPYDASSNTSVEAVVNTAGKVPYVERARFTSNAAFRMMMVVKVESFVFTASYRLRPDGRPVNDSVATEFAGSFMGSSQTLRTRTAYSDYVAAR